MAEYTYEENLDRIIEQSKVYCNKVKGNKRLEKVNIRLLERNKDDCKRFLKGFLEMNPNYDLNLLVKFPKKRTVYPYITGAAAFLTLYTYLMGQKYIISGFDPVEVRLEDTIKLKKVKSFEDFHVFKAGEIKKVGPVQYNNEKIIISSKTDPNLCSLYSYFYSEKDNNFTPVFPEAMNLLIKDEKVKEKYEEGLKQYIKENSGDLESIKLYEAVMACPSKFIQKPGGARNIGPQKSKRGV